MNQLITKIFSKDNREYILLAALAIVCMLWFKSCSNANQTKAEMKRQEKISEQNMRALNDTIRIVKNKAGELESVKSSYVSKLSDLEKINKDLYAEIKKEKGTTNAVIKSYVSVSSGDVVISNELKRYSDGVTYGLEFEDTKTDSGMTWHIKGVSKFEYDKLEIIPGTTEIFENQMKIKLVLGFKTAKNGDYEVFAKSASPNVKFDELDGVLIIPKKKDDILCPPAKKKRFGLGIQIGYGATSINKQIFVSPYVGAGISYNIINF